MNKQIVVLLLILIGVVGLNLYKDLHFQGGPSSGPALPSLTPQPRREIPPIETKDGIPDLALIVLNYVLKQDDLNNPFISVLTNDGVYASGNVGEANGGGMGWYAKKIDGEWTIVYTGQSIPKCADIFKYNLPEDFLKCEEY